MAGAIEPYRLDGGAAPAHSLGAQIPKRAVQALQAMLNGLLIKSAS